MQAKTEILKRSACLGLRRPGIAICLVEDVAVPAWRGKQRKGAAGLFPQSPYLKIFGDATDGDTGGTSGLELGEVRVLIEGEHNAVITAPSIGSGAAMTALPAATKLWLAAGQNRPTGVFTNPPLDDNSYYHHWINACFGRETRLG